MIETFKNYELELDIRGSGAKTIEPGQTQVIELFIEGDRLLTGLEYVRKDGNLEDTADFQFLFAGNIIRTLASNVMLHPHGLRYEAYKAKILAGMTLRVTYKNNGANPAAFGFNAILHREK